MRKILLLICISIAFKTNAQTLEDNKTDEFTNTKIKRTSWEKLNKNNLEFYSHFRISQLNDLVTFDLKIMLPMAKVFAIDKDASLMLKLKNGEVVTFKSLEYKISCVGCGAVGFLGSAGHGVYVSYFTDVLSLEKLKNTEIEKIRIYTTEGFIEDIVSENNSKKINKSIELIMPK